MTRLDGIAPGSLVVVRDEEWIVTHVSQTRDGTLIAAQGLGELVAGTTAQFFSELDDIRPFDPRDTKVIADDSPNHRRARLWLEATLRKTSHESLGRLFVLAHRVHAPDGDEELKSQALRVDLFRLLAITHIAEIGLGNEALLKVLRMLLLSKESNKADRGLISHVELGINQLGDVYEGPMSHTGSFATEDLYEVARGGDPSTGSWVAPVDRSDHLDPADFVKVRNEERGTDEPVMHHKSTFAIEVVRQLAKEYLSRREEEIGPRTDPETRLAKPQKVKAQIALHQVYGVDLNATAKELAEVSLWLDTVEKGLAAPLFGLRLRRERPPGLQQGLVEAAQARRTPTSRRHGSLRPHRHPPVPRNPLHIRIPLRHSRPRARYPCWSPRLTHWHPSSKGSQCLLIALNYLCAETRSKSSTLTFSEESILSIAGISANSCGRWKRSRP